VDCVVWKVERNLLNIEMKENVKIDKEINPKKWYIMKGYYKKLYVRVCKGSYLRVTTNGSAQGISLKSPTLDSQVSV